MDALTRFFLESPFQLGVACAIAITAALLARPRLEGRMRTHAPPATLAVAALLFALQWAVTTPRERVREALDRFIAAIERRDEAGLRAAIDPDYDGESLTAESLGDAIVAALERVEIFDTRVRGCEIDVRDDSAAVRLTAMATVKLQGFPRRLSGQWQIEWRRAADRWRIMRILPVEIGGQPMESLRDVLTAARRG
ncbi:MAG: nuclear transport factor 2 family protein [Phycisphaerae bacterium]|nr:nuclear transport factor 2 family protein [Phycisphaerae bacterium]